MHGKMENKIERVDNIIIQFEIKIYYFSLITENSHTCGVEFTTGKLRVSIARIKCLPF